MRAAAFRTGIAALSILGLLSGPAGADVVVYYHAGGWDAFSGPGDDGKPVCGVGSTNQSDNRSFSFRVQIGDGSGNVTFQAKKPTWRLPVGTLLPVVLQVGLNTPFSLLAAGKGQVAEWSLDASAFQTFDAQFRHAGSMTVTFPLGDEPPWMVVLNGSTAISGAFVRCIADLTRRQAIQPPPAVPDQTETQEPGPAQPPPAPSQPYLSPVAPTQR